VESVAQLGKRWGRMQHIELEEVLCGSFFDCPW